jgi:hypothetical protein
MTTCCLGRRELLATAAAGVGVAVGAGDLSGATLAAFTEAESTSSALDTGVWNTAPKRVTHTTSGALSTATDSTTASYAVNGVDVVGPVEPGFDGSDYHIPIVDGDSTLVRVAADGTQTSFGLDATRTPRGTKSMLATAAWNGHPLSVYYPGDSASRIYRVEPGASATQVAQLSNGVKAVLGAGDVDGDGVAEFVFVDGSGTVRYIVPDTDSTTRGVKSTGVSPGSNNNYGAGSPVDIGGYGVVVPAVNGSGGLGLLDADGWIEASLTAGSTAKKSPVFGCDFDDDGAVEIAFAGYADGHLQYLDDVGETNSLRDVTDSSGDPIAVDPTRGVR